MIDILAGFQPVLVDNSESFMACSWSWPMIIQDNFINKRPSVGLLTRLGTFLDWIWLFISSIKILTCSWSHISLKLDFLALCIQTKVSATESQGTSTNHGFLHLAPRWGRQAKAVEEWQRMQFFTCNIKWQEKCIVQRRQECFERTWRKAKFQGVSDNSLVETCYHLITSFHPWIWRGDNFLCH